MTRRNRIILASLTGLSGLMILAYWLYAKAAVDGFVGMFEALGLEPQVTRDPWFALIPYLGGVLIVSAFGVLLFPLVRRLIERAGR